MAIIMANFLVIAVPLLARFIPWAVYRATTKQHLARKTDLLPSFLVLVLLEGFVISQLIIAGVWLRKLRLA